MRSATRIMHVDDEPDVREIVRLCLELDPEIEVRSCASGREALMAVHEWAPDLILLDLVMPAMNGVATLAMLNSDSRTADVPVVFLTVMVQQRAVDHAEIDYLKSLGARGVIAKPFDALSLAPSVLSFLRPDPVARYAV